LSLHTIVETYLQECRRLHWHNCPGQILGIRMALLGCRLIGIAEPRGSDRKKLIVCVEIDRCLTDAINVVTGVSLGKRSLKFFDYGKVAATFWDIDSGKAARLVALDGAREMADKRYSELPLKKERQMRAYTQADDEELFKIEAVQVHLNGSDLPGHPHRRVQCRGCGEGVNDGREIVGREGVFCRYCAEGGYYRLEIKS
jgi:formylmethanofuran dehydrogenase subunit E